MAASGSQAALASSQGKLAACVYNAGAIDPNSWQKKSNWWSGNVNHSLHMFERFGA